MDKFFDNEFTDSIKGELKRRFYSPLYGTYIATWCIFHWEFLYTAIFVSEERIWVATKLLKNQYLKETYLDFTSFQFYIFQAIPLFLTYLIIWHFPKWITIPAFKKHLQYKSKQAELVIDTERRLEKRKVEELKATSKRVKQQRKVIEAEKEVARIDPDIGYSNEYNDFKNSEYYDDFKYIISSIYEHKGDITTYDFGGRILFEIPQRILVYAHSNDLINIDRTKNIIELTEKGKSFVKKYSSDHDASF